MTTTQVINAQSIGTSTNKGHDLFAIRLTPAAASDRFYVEAVVTNGAGTFNRSSKIAVWVATYNASITASGAPAIMRHTAKMLDVIMESTSAAVTSYTSDLIPLGGPYIYLWLDVPTLPAASTISVWIHEGP